MGTYVSNVLTKRLTATGTVSAGPARLLAIYFVADTTEGSIELADRDWETYVPIFSP